MTTLLTSLRWGASALLATVFLLAIWACDFDVGLEVAGEDVNVTGAGGTASHIEAKIRASGKACNARIRLNGVVGQNGCIQIPPLCGQPAQQICGLQPGQPFNLDIEVDGGGMVAIQIPETQPGTGMWKFYNAITGDSTAIEISDTPFGYTVFPPLSAESGKKIVYARYSPAFADTLFGGILAGSFMSPRVGPDAIKFIILGQLRARSAPGFKLTAPDSNFAFPELPRVSNFSLVGPPYVVTYHVVDGNWGVISEADAAALGISTEPGSRYVGFVPRGATTSMIDTGFTLRGGGDSAHGSYHSTVSLGASQGIVVRFDRDDFYDVADSTNASQTVMLSGSLADAPYPIRFNIPARLTNAAGVGRNADAPGSTLSMTNAPHPNPFTSKTTLGYRLASRAHVIVTVVDMSGRTVATLRDGVDEAGEHSVTLDAGSLPSGGYTIEIRAGEDRASTNVTLVR